MCVYICERAYVCMRVDRQCLRVEFVLKTCSGYPKDAGVTTYTIAKPGNPLRFFDGWFLIQSGEADSTCCSVLQCVAV